jgi:hypothetical protein
MFISIIMLAAKPNTFQHWHPLIFDGPNSNIILIFSSPSQDYLRYSYEILEAYSFCTQVVILSSDFSKFALNRGGEAKRDFHIYLHISNKIQRFL